MLDSVVCRVLCKYVFLSAWIELTHAKRAAGLALLFLLLQLAMLALFL